MSYREFAVPEPLRQFAERRWSVAGAGRSQILPDGCMDLIEMDGAVLVAGPDTSAFLSDRRTESTTGIRFRPGALPRLLGVPAGELRNMRVPLRDLLPEHGSSPLSAVTTRLLGGEPTPETAPWTLAQLNRITLRLSAGAEVSTVADEIGCSARTLQRQCDAVFGYAPTTLRRVLRFRRAISLLRSGAPLSATAAHCGYADQSHLHREVRVLAGTPVADFRQLSNGANTSMVEPSGSVTLA